MYNTVSFVARNESSERFKLKPKTFTYLKILWIFCWLQKCHEYYYESFIVESKRATRIKDFSSSMAHLLLLLSLVFCILVAYFQIEYEMRLSSNENVFRCDVQDWKYMQRQEISIFVVTTSTFLSNMHKSQKTRMFYVFVLTFCLLSPTWSHFQSKIVEIHWTWENWTENNNFSYCMQGKENPAKGTSSQRVDRYKPLIYSNLRPVIRDNWKSVVFFQ